MQRMELLAPAGGQEQLEYAIRFGADAVYLAADRFGMRARAANFAMDQLPHAVQTAHDAGVKVHLTCNVMMHEQDMAQLPAFLEQVADAGVDALIVGDLGALALARTYAPHVEIHASTQASICNADATRVWHDLGATRVVAAREMSLEDLATMKSRMPQGLQLEAFAHGAMCMAYSGRCLISDFLNPGRSGVHGNCSQSCRWQYSLMEEWRKGEYYPVEEDARGTYILNAEDLCMLEHLDDLARAGVDSVKIEGRNKKAYYVACVVNAYRQVLDGANPADFLRELDCVSHRPYSTGFYYGMAHQTVDNLVYVRNTDWALQIHSCQPQQDGTFKAEATCRSKFFLGDQLELLSPRKAVAPVRVIQAWHNPASRVDVLGFEPPADWKPWREEPYAVEEVNHPGERYFVTVDRPVLPGDIIRVLR